MTFAESTDIGQDSICGNSATGVIGEKRSLVELISFNKILGV